MSEERQATQANIGFLLAKASQRWNELLYAFFSAAGYSEVRPSYGSILLPLFHEDGLRMGELARRARLSKQTMTTMIRLMEKNGLVTRQRDPQDGRAYRIFLSVRAREFQQIAEEALDELDDIMRSVLSSDRIGDLKESLQILMDIEITQGETET